MEDFAKLVEHNAPRVSWICSVDAAKGGIGKAHRQTDRALDRVDLHSCVSGDTNNVAHLAFGEWQGLAMVYEDRKSTVVGAYTDIQKDPAVYLGKKGFEQIGCVFRGAENCGGAELSVAYVGNTTESIVNKLFEGGGKAVGIYYFKLGTAGSCIREIVAFIK